MLLMTGSSLSGGMPGDDEADRVVDPPLEERDESPFGPPGVRVPTPPVLEPRSRRRGDGGDIAGVVGNTAGTAPALGVLVAGVVNVVVKFFCALRGALEDN